MGVEAPVLAIVLLAVLVVDTVACSIPIKYIQDDLNRLNVAPTTQRIVPIVKAAAVLGLTIGLWVPVVGVLACVGLVAYFICALAVHRREDDDLARYVPAIAFLVAAGAALVFSYAPGV